MQLRLFMIGKVAAPKGGSNTTLAFNWAGDRSVEYASHPRVPRRITWDLLREPTGTAAAGPLQSSGARLPHSAQRLQSCIAPAFGVRGGRMLPAQTPHMKLRSNAQHQFSKLFALATTRSRPLPCADDNGCPCPSAPYESNRRYSSQAERRSVQIRQDSHRPSPNRDSCTGPTWPAPTCTIYKIADRSKTTRNDASRCRDRNRTEW